MSSRWWIPLWIACGSLGAGLGIAADFVAGGVDLKANELIAAVIMSPLAIAAGGFAVEPPFLGPYCVIGGLLFVPGYALLTWRWRKSPSVVGFAAVFVWCFQGYFELLHRFESMMSV